MSKSTENKLVSFYALTDSAVSHATTQAQTSETAYAQTSDIDDLRMYQSHTTKALYIEALKHMSANAAETLVTLFSAKQIKTMLDEKSESSASKNSYSLQKVACMCEAIAHNDSRRLVAESTRAVKNEALYRFVRYMKSSDLDQTMSNYDKAVAADTFTQCNQCYTLLHRLDAVKYYKRKDANIIEFIRDNKLIEALMSLTF
jgi:Mg/Co/Ni transporter MgtE